MNKNQVLESEAVILGSLLLEPKLGTKIFSRLNPDDLVGGEGLNETIFLTIQNIVSEGNLIDIPAVIQMLSLAGHENNSALEYITNLTEKVTSLESIDTHIAIVLESSKKRKSVKILEQARAEAENWEIPAEELWIKINQQSFEILKGSQHQIQHIWSGGEENGIYNQRMEILKAKETADPLYTGWEEIDSILPSGFARGDVSVIAARPGVGKSSWRFNLERRLLDRGFGGVLISTEQSKEVETDRQDSILTEIPLMDIIRSQQWDKNDPKLDLIKSANRYKDEMWNYDMLFGRQLDVAQIWEFMTVINRKRPKDYIIIDLFDRLTDVNVSANKPMTVSKKVGEISALAAFFNVHICLIVQISRQVERRTEKRPRLSDLKDSGNYEEAARLVLLLYRDAYYNPESLSNIIEINVAKQNQGEAGPNVIIPFTFDPETLIQAPQPTRGY